MKVLICGAGVAGLTLAWCLERAGHDVILIERSGHLRDDGYMVDFFGSGYDASEQLGLLARLQSIHDPVERLTLLDGNGCERVSVSYPNLRDRLFRNRHVNFMRGDLVRVFHDRVNGRCDVRLATTVLCLQRHEHKVVVRLTDNTSQEVDLLVGADGVHSIVRHLTFGPETKFSQFLGYHAVAFVIDDPPRTLHPGKALVTFTVPNRLVNIYPIRAGRIATFFLYRSNDVVHEPTAHAACRELYATYRGLGWIVPQLLDYCTRADSVYFDAVEQIRMTHWSVGRVVLVGDACHCLSPLAGNGASMAIAGTYVLAEELTRSGDLAGALTRYERRVRPAIERQQRAARRMAKWLVPATKLGVSVRDAITRAASWPSVALVLRHQMAAESIFHG